MRIYHFYLLCIVLFLAYSGHAQYRMDGRYRPYYSHRYGEQPYFKPEVTFSLGYGFPNLDKYQLLEFYEDYKGAATGTGPIYGTVDYRFNRRTSIGVMIAYGKVKAPYYNFNSSSNQPDFTGYKEGWSIMLNMVRYLPVSPSVSPYIRTAIGVNLGNERYSDSSGNKVAPDQNSPQLAYQASIGVQVNITRKVGLFAEAGYGKYILSSGLFFKL